MGHPVMQWQIVTRNPDKVAAFYSELFGWEIHQNTALNYRIVDTGSERGIHGGIWPAPPDAATFIQLFVEVGDVAAHVAKAVAQGAKVLVPPQALPAGEVMAVLMDPEGMSFGVMQSVG